MNYQALRRKNNPVKVKEQRIRFFQNNPWIRSFYKAKERCENPKCNKYPSYGGKGIKFLLSKEDIEYIWFRDKAYLMKRPSIDRKDGFGDYVFYNCRFIELSENSSRGGKNRWRGK